MTTEQLINDNAGHIWKIAQGFYNVDKKDLFQAGVVGLLKAYKNYKKDGETKFSTYAHDYIFGEMYTLANNRNIKISKDILKLYKLIEKTRYSLAQRFGRVPSNHELASFLEMEEDKIYQAVACANLVMMSFDDDKEESRNLHETIAAPQILSQDDKIMLDSSFKVLDPMEKNIISSRYYEDLTQSETARKLGITQVMVSRYEKKSLEKMREYMYL